MKTWRSRCVWNGAQQTKKETTTAAESDQFKLKTHPLNVFVFVFVFVSILPSIWKTDFLLPLLSFWSAFMLLPRLRCCASRIFKPILIRYISENRTRLTSKVWGQKELGCQKNPHDLDKRPALNFGTFVPLVAEAQFMKSWQQWGFRGFELLKVWY